jgi:hypothetical protein
VLLGSAVVLATVIVIELLVAAALVVDPQLERARRCGLLFFAALAVVAFSESVTGDANCGCFGPLPVTPWFTLTFDLFAVAVLLVLGGARTRRSRGFRKTGQPLSWPRCSSWRLRRGSFALVTAVRELRSRQGRLIS